MVQLSKKIIIEGVITTKTGLHIGGTNSSMSIGGTDSIVVRNPLNNKPYIPGSSLKGKMRSMLDLADGTIISVTMGQVKNGTSQDHRVASVKLFGNAPNSRDEKEKGIKQIPSRVMVRDGKLIGTDEELDKIFKNTDLPYTESKTEVVIDRITAKAMPRTLERVPAGAEFELNLVVNIFQGDDEKDQIMNLERAMKLLQDDYLGGSGSRGYGQIEFKVKKVKERKMSFYENKEKEGELTQYFKDFR